MKKITTEEFEKRSLNYIDRIVKHPVGKELTKMEIGEVLSVKFKEWDVNYISVKLAYLGNQLGGRKFSLRTDKRNEEWLIKRVK